MAKTIGDNWIYITKDGKKSKYFGLDLTKVTTGVEDPAEKEVVKNPDTGLNEVRNLVTDQEIYNVNTKKKSKWFILDLETGSRGWCPGCTIQAEIKAGEGIPNPVPIMEEPSDESEILATITYLDKAQVLDENAVKELPKSGWLNIKYNDVIGYIKNAYASVKYHYPESIPRV